MKPLSVRSLLGLERAEVWGQQGSRAVQGDSLFSCRATSLGSAPATPSLLTPWSYC